MCSSRCSSRCSLRQKKTLFREFAGLDGKLSVGAVGALGAAVGAAVGAAGAASDNNIALLVGSSVRKSCLISRLHLTARDYRSLRKIHLSILFHPIIFALLFSLPINRLVQLRSGVT